MLLVAGCWLLVDCY